MRLIVTSLLYITTLLPAQQDETCKQTILDYITAITSVQAPAPGKAYYLHFTTETVSAYPAKTPSYSIDAHVYLADKRMTYQTRQITLTQDTEDAFMIIHNQKRIIWTKGGINPAEQKERLNLGSIQKSVVEKASVSYCREEEKNGQKIKIIGLLPDRETAEKMNIRSITFTYSHSLQRMQKVVIEFAKAAPLLQQSVTYHDIDFDYKKFKPTASHGQVFASSGKLLPKYQGYTVVDNKNSND